MEIESIRRLLRQLATDARTGRLTSSGSDIASLAEQLETRLGRGVSLKEFKSETISFGPGRCPTCGK